MKNKFAFTLAEVLITLVIIGVVAALTIPTAINKYKDEELKSQFKKAYSTISQAVYKTEMNDFFGYAECYYPIVDDDYNISSSGAKFGQCNSFYRAFKKNLQIQKSCNGNAKAGGCIPDYQSYNTDGSCGGFGRNQVENYSDASILSNGQIIISYSTAPASRLCMFLVDINGMKGPNAYGKDLFSFVITKDKSGSMGIKRGICEFPVEGGKSTMQMIRYALAGKK